MVEHPHQNGADREASDAITAPLGPLDESQRDAELITGLRGVLGLEEEGVGRFFPIVETMGYFLASASQTWRNHVNPRGQQCCTTLHR